MIPPDFPQEGRMIYPLVSIDVLRYSQISADILRQPWISRKFSLIIRGSPERCFHNCVIVKSSSWYFYTCLDCESNSGLPEPRPKKSELDDVKRTGDDGVDDDLVSDYGDSAVENGHVSDRSRNERDKRRRDKKEYSKTIGRRTDDEYDRPKTTKYRSFSVDSECSKSGRSERNSGSKKKVKTDVAKEFRSHDRDEGDTRDDEGEMELNRDVFSDDGPLRRKRFTVRRRYKDLYDVNSYVDHFVILVLFFLSRSTVLLALEAARNQKVIYISYWIMQNKPLFVAYIRQDTVPRLNAITVDDGD